MEIDSEMTVRGNPTVAAGRLQYVFNMIETRRASLDMQAAEEKVPAAGVRYTGPAYVLHITDLPPLLDDDECRAYIEHAIRHGGRCGVVVKVYGEPDEIGMEIAKRSGRLLAEALQAGRTLQVVPASSGVERPALVERLREPGGELAAAVLLRDAETASAILAGMIMEATAGAAALAHLANELRRAADAISPNGGGIPCPLCLASPVFRPDEIETHLIQKHAKLGEGMRP